MRTVSPMADDPRGRVASGKGFKIGRKAISTADDDARAYAELAALVEGFHVEIGEERVEGSAPGADRKLLQKLRRGEPRPAAELDLHGQTQSEAQGALERFVERARQDGHRAVLVVHGRGLHSDDKPILKTRVAEWLSTGKLARVVLAFSTAQPGDGGAGALYVLLRR
jgi:DNA-nicking Smr family endonuclease